MEFGNREHGDSGTEASVHLIDLTDEEAGAPFAVRDANEGPDSRGAHAAGLDLWAWMGNHPVVVGITTGVICFAIIAAAVNLALNSNSRNTGDDPVAGAAISETDGGRGSFSGDSLNFTSDDPKRTGTVGAPKTLIGLDTDSDEYAAAAPAVGEDALDVNPNSGGDTGSADSNGNGATDGNSGGDQGTNGSGATPTTSGVTSSTARTASTVRNTVTTRRTATPRPTSTPATTSTSANTASTAQTTQATTATTASTTTSSPPTTPSTPPPASGLIAAPGNFSAHPMSSITSFAANAISGASQYCWSFSQPGASSRGPFCSAATIYDMPAGALDMEPGLVNVTATASGPSVSQTESMTIIFTSTKVFAQPKDGATVRYGRTFPVRITGVVGASDHLLLFIQDGYSSGWISYGNQNGTTITSNHPLWDDLVTGDLTIVASVQGAGRVLASATVDVTIVD